MGRGEPDWKPARRVRDSEAMRKMHRVESRCRLCPRTDISAHHLVPRSRGGDDIYPGNLVPLCGDGTRGHHSDVEEYKSGARYRLREALTEAEKEYVIQKRGRAWLDRQYPKDKYSDKAPARTRQCVNRLGIAKLRFATKFEAESHAAETGDSRVEAYHCQTCGGFHVGKRRGMFSP